MSNKRKLSSNNNPKHGAKKRKFDLSNNNNTKMVCCICLCKCHHIHYMNIIQNIIMNYWLQQHQKFNNVIQKCKENNILNNNNSDNNNNNNNNNLNTKNNKKLLYGDNDAYRINYNQYIKNMIINQILII